MLHPHRLPSLIYLLRCSLQPWWESVICIIHHGSEIDISIGSPTFPNMVFVVPGRGIRPCLWGLNGSLAASIQRISLVVLGFDSPKSSSLFHHWKYLIAAGAGGMSASIAPSSIHFVASSLPLVPQRPRTSSFPHASCLSNSSSQWLSSTQYICNPPPAAFNTHQNCYCWCQKISIVISAKRNSWIIAENLVLLKMRGYQYRKKMLSFSHGSPRDCNHLDVLVSHYHHGWGC